MFILLNFLLLVYYSWTVNNKTDVSCTGNKVINLMTGFYIKIYQKNCFTITPDDDVRIMPPALKTSKKITIYAKFYVWKDKSRYKKPIRCIDERQMTTFPIVPFARYFYTTSILNTIGDNFLNNMNGSRSLKSLIGINKIYIATWVESCLEFVYAHRFNMPNFMTFIKFKYIRRFFVLKF